GLTPAADEIALIVVGNRDLSPREWGLMVDVGICTVDLTPDYPVIMDGFGARGDRPSEGIDNPITGTCVIFDDGDTRLGIMALDLLAVDDYLLVPVRRAAQDAGIPPKNMMLNTSHTHCAPNVTPCRSFMRAYTEKYLVECRDRLCDLVSGAVDDLQPATLDYSVGTSTMGMNRRRAGDSGLLPNPDKPIDLDVPVLRVLQPDGTVRGLLFSYACHPSGISGFKIGTDFPGFAREYIEQKLADCKTGFLQGCGGDVKPRNLDPRTRSFASGPLEVIQELGHELGRAVMAALCGTPQPLGDTVAADSEYVQIPFTDQPTEADVEEQADRGHRGTVWAHAVRDFWEAGHRLPYQHPLEVQVFDIGGLTVVGIAAEVCVEVGMHIKERLSDQTVMTLGYTNGGWDYFAPESAHTEEGYTEGYEVKRSFTDTIWPYPQPLGFSDDSEQIMLDAIERIVREIA
ncbi:MAG: hypothetical protein ACLFWB_06630, partial [Armatimonadota bacterium]